jgi:hypothetical protein
MPQAHPRPETLQNYALDLLSVAESASIETHLMKCSSCRRNLARVGPAEEWVGKERRREPRARVEGAAQIRVLDPLASGTRSESVRIVDSSKRGMRLKVPHELSKGAIIRVCEATRIVFGEVVYCVPAEDKFHAGIQLMDVF